MIIQQLTKEQLKQLKKLPKGMKTDIQKNTGIARSTINMMLWKETASQETITKLFNYLNNVQ